MSIDSNALLITKASGEIVPYSPTKLIHSLKHSGADDKTIDDVLRKIQPKLYEGISTKKIYQLAFSILKSQTKHWAARYKLKNAIMELGPSGFPFEKYIASVLQQLGYSVKVNEFVSGRCVNHEVDIVALKADTRFMIECKYHNHTGYSCDVKIPLYIQARFEDIVNKENQNNSLRFDKGWVFTNTKFTDDAIKYGNCIGLKLTGWNYPGNSSLRDLIDSSGLYPITCLTSLTRHEKQILLEQRIVLCKELIDDPNLLSSAHIGATRSSQIIHEARVLYEGQFGSSNDPEKQPVKLRVDE